jgi:hypothetical protein
METKINIFIFEEKRSKTNKLLWVIGFFEQNGGSGGNGDL